MSFSPKKVWYTGSVSRFKVFAFRMDSHFILKSKSS